MSVSQDRLSLAEVRQYVSDRHGFTPTRQTIHNWFRKGVGGSFLSVIEVPAAGPLRFKLMTTRQAVDDFLSSVSPLLLQARRRLA